MARYVYRGDQPRSFDTLGLLLEPGEEFETPEEISHPDIEAVTEPADTGEKE